MLYEKTTHWLAGWSSSLGRRRLGADLTRILKSGKDQWPSRWGTYRCVWRGIRSHGAQVTNERGPRDDPKWTKPLSSASAYDVPGLSQCGFSPHSTDTRRPSLATIRSGAGCGR